MTAVELARHGGPCTPVPAQDVDAAAVATLETYASMPREAFGYMKAWFQAPRIAALEEAIRFTAATRAGRNEEVSNAVETFFGSKS
jgi:hypothetical protein